MFPKKCVKNICAFQESYFDNNCSMAKCYMYIDAYIITLLTTVIIKYFCRLILMLFCLSMLTLFVEITIYCHGYPS